MCARVFAAFKAKKDGQQESEAGEEAAQAVHETQGLEMMPSRDIVLACVLIHDPGADQVHGGDHAGKAEAHQGRADDGRDEGVGEEEGDVSEGQDAQGQAPDAHQVKLAHEEGPQGHTGDGDHQDRSEEKGGLGVGDLQGVLDIEGQAGQDEGHGGAVKGVGETSDPELAVGEEALEAVPEFGLLFIGLQFASPGW